MVGSYLQSIDVSTATVSQIQGALAHAAELYGPVKELTEQVKALPKDMTEGIIAAIGVSPEIDAQIGDWASKVAAFEADLAKFKAASDAFFAAADTVQTALDRDPKAEALNAVAAAHASTFDKVGLARSALGDLLIGYDGSVDATNNLATATNAYRDAQVAALVQIDQVRTSLSTMFGDSIQNMDLAILSAADQKKFYIDEALATKKLLETTTDPVQIEKLSGIINKDLNTVFGMLSPAEQKLQHDYLKGILTDTKTITDKQLTTSAGLITDAGTAGGNVISLAKAELTAAGVEWHAAAGSMTTSADLLRAAGSDLAQAAKDSKDAAAAIKQAAADKRRRRAEQRRCRQHPSAGRQHAGQGFCHGDRVDRRTLREKGNA